MKAFFTRYKDIELGIKTAKLPCQKHYKPKFLADSKTNVSVFLVKQKKFFINFLNGNKNDFC